MALTVVGLGTYLWHIDKVSAASWPLSPASPGRQSLPVAALCSSNADLVRTLHPIPPHLGNSCPSLRSQIKCHFLREVFFGQFFSPWCFNSMRFLSRYLSHNYIVMCEKIWTSDPAYTWSCNEAFRGKVNAINSTCLEKECIPSV